MKPQLFFTLKFALLFCITIPFVSFGQACDPAENLDIEIIDNTTVNVTWEEMAGAVEYMIDVSVDGNLIMEDITQTPSFDFPYDNILGGGWLSIGVTVVYPGCISVPVRIDPPIIATIDVVYNNKVICKQGGKHAIASVSSSNTVHYVDPVKGLLVMTVNCMCDGFDELKICYNDNSHCVNLGVPNPNPGATFGKYVHDLHIASELYDFFNTNFDCVQSTKSNIMQTTPMATIYPNPVKNLLTLELEKSTSEIIGIDIINLDGKVIQEWFHAETNKNNLIQLDLQTERFSTGLYFLRVKTTDDLQTFQFLKE